MKLINVFTATLIMIGTVSCNAKSASPETAELPSDRIEAYYFHFTARCVTCNTIEANAKENLETLYPNQFSNGLITFQSINLEDPSSKPLAKRLGVTGQTLMIIKGEQKVNITNEGFLYAVTKPERFREIINEKVDFLLMKQ